MIKARGYCTRNFCSLEGGYYCKPTPLQKASYGLRVVQAVRASNEALLGKLLRCGLSPNPCNDFGESIVHMACRRGDSKLLRVLVQAGCCLQVTDDFGRTPLHDACWASKPIEGGPAWRTGYASSPTRTGSKSSRPTCVSPQR